MLLKEIIIPKSIYTLCGQNAELPIVKAGGAYNYHRVLRD
jgi:hypothetical protein